MALRIIGAGFGRTGTYSLKAALERLGFGPCHHMSEVIGRPAQIELWRDAAAGRPDYDAIFTGYAAAVDFPVAAYWQEVHAAHPGARVILSQRDAEDWFASFSQTILPLLKDRASWPAHARPWFEMAEQVVIGRALRGRTDRAGILAAFRANEAAATALAATGRALIFRAGDGWAPLCEFLGVKVPAEPYPTTNARSDFFASVKAGTDALVT